jgi:hypothetical protein
MLLDTIRNDLETARLAAFSATDPIIKEVHNVVVDLLRTLVADTEIVGKNNGNRATTDEETLNVVLSFIKNANTTYNHLVSRMDTLAKVITPDSNESAELAKLTKAETKIGAEISCLKGYLPTQATQEEIEAVIAEVGSNIGIVMKALTAKFGKGKFDAALAKKLVTG